ncbi:MAG TPA: glutathione S-transferase N-terminal domain-containing protein [Caulobacteraceae bacterium]|jgi:glutathione S-transferase
MSEEIILHHYDTSPFSEKPRLLFGLRNLAWRSVIQPTIMPKPDLTPLTGGYRRAPVMQIGADVFCDSQVILAEIERRAGTAVDGLAWAVNLWADRVFFTSSVAVIFGEIGESVPRAFIEDREKLMGRPFDVAAMKAAGGPMRAQWRTQAGWIDAALASGGGPFLAGAAGGLADLAAYMNIWFMVSFAPHIGEALLADFDALNAWRERVKAIGHGARTEMTPAEALEAARAAEPAVEVAHDGDDPSGLQPGARVAVSADDYGREPILGRLVAANRERVVIERQDQSLGRLHVHFPRAGYIVAPAT